jgi:cytoskeletal protein CcmA (bactofilin family)
MFTNKGKGPDSLPVVPEPGTMRRTPPSRAMTSIIANGVKITGSVTTDGEIQIDGEIEGDLRGGSVTIGDTGMVKGDLVCEAVLVNGRVEGSVRSRKVQLARNAHVLGDIVHQQLSVEMGAVFEGQCRYLQDPLRAEGQNHAPAPRLSSSVDHSAPESTVSPFGGGTGSVFGEPAGRDRIVVTGASS